MRFAFFSFNILFINTRWEVTTLQELLRIFQVASPSRQQATFFRFGCTLLSSLPSSSLSRLHPRGGCAILPATNNTRLFAGKTLENENEATTEWMLPLIFHA